MKCHYEVLDLERDADEAKIKTAYRKAALRYHPDKNLDDPEGAKTRFQLVQQAYEVLSDPQERAWYDKHREQIIRGSGSDFEDNSLNVYQYFTASCYKGFGDDDEGFYTVFRNVFEQLASEEVEYLDSEAEFEAIPRFGHSKSDYEEEVHPFYSYWQSFCTRKSYAWLSTHNINEIRDRRILKVVEKDNKKIQQKARKERNEEIRSLVSFVRKRDKRVQAQRKLLEERAAENRKRQAQLDLQQVLRRKEELAEQMKNQANFLDEGYEEQLRQLEKALKVSDDEDDDFGVDGVNAGIQDIHIDLSELNGDQLDCDEFFCVACNKTFKNQSSYKNHESSKKHKENVELIKSEMLQEEDQLQSDDEETESAEEVVDEEGKVTEEEEAKEEVVIKTSSSRKKKKQKNAPNTGKLAQDSEEDDEAPNLFLNQPDSDDDWSGAGSSKTKKAKAKTAAKKEPKQKKSKGNVVAANKTEELLAEKPPLSDEDCDDEKPSSAAVDVDHKCVTCKEEFSSKNKLFSHLKKTNHGVYIPKGKVVTESDIPELRKGKNKRRN